MRPSRGLAAALFMIGLIGGSLAYTVPERAPRRTDGGWLLAADFHVHAFPGDGVLAPLLLRREAARQGLDAIAITNHNQVITSRFARWLAERMPGPLVIVGEEVTSRQYHLIAAGIERSIDWDQPAADAIEAIHAQGGVAIAAHPGRGFRDGWDERAMMLLDGAETAHPSMQTSAASRDDLPEFSRRARLRNPDLAAIGSSDFHQLTRVGWCRTYLLAREPTAAGVLDAVRAGRTVAEDGRGRLFGDPALVQRVEAQRGEMGPVLPHQAWRGLTLACALAGLIGLIVIGPDGRETVD